ARARTDGAMVRLSAFRRDWASCGRESGRNGDYDPAPWVDLGTRRPLHRLDDPLEMLGLALAVVSRQAVRPAPEFLDHADAVQRVGQVRSWPLSATAQRG